MGQTPNNYNQSKASVCELTCSVGQSFGNGAVVAVTFDTETVDTDGYHSAGNPTRITVPKAGKYLFTANLSFPTNATGNRYLWLAKNGTSTQRYGLQGCPGLAGGDAGLSTSRVFTLAANDYIEAYGYQNSGGSLTNNADNTAPGYTGFTVTRLGD